MALYVLPILGGSVLRLSRGGMTIALWSGVSFGLIVASQYGLVIPRPEHWGLTNAILPLPVRATRSIRSASTSSRSSPWPGSPATWPRACTAPT